MIRKITLFSLIVSLLGIFTLFGQAEAQDALKLYEQNKLYESLSRLEEKKDYYSLLKAKIFHNLGMISGKLYFLSSNDLNTYKKILTAPPHQRIIGDKGKVFEKRIARLNREAKFEEAVLIIQELLAILKREAGRNSVYESMRYYDSNLYLTISQSYLALAIANYRKCLSELPGKEEEVRGLIGECYFEMAAGGAKADNYKAALQNFTALNMENANNALYLVKMWHGYRKIGNKEEARKLLDRIKSKHLQDPGLKSELGLYMMDAKETEAEGKQLIRAAYADIFAKKTTEKRYLSVYRNYAFLNKAAKDYAKAIPAMETIIEASPAHWNKGGTLCDPVPAIETVSVYIYPRRYEDALRMLYDLQVYYPEVSPIYNLVKEIAALSGK